MICGGLNSFPSIFAFRKWFDLKIWFLGQFFANFSKKISDWTFNDCKVQLSWIVVPTGSKIRMDMEGQKGPARLGNEVLPRKEVLVELLENSPVGEGTVPTTTVVLEHVQRTSAKSIPAATAEVHPLSHRYIQNDTTPKTETGGPGGVRDHAATIAPLWYSDFSIGILYACLHPSRPHAPPPAHHRGLWFRRQ